MFFYQNNFSTYFQIQIKLISASYICTSFLHNINENKSPLYEILNNIFRKKIIPSIQKLRQLKNELFHYVLLLWKFINYLNMCNI